jgi:hypothetical protein
MKVWNFHSNFNFRVNANTLPTAKEMERKDLMRQRNVDFHVRKE